MRVGLVLLVLLVFAGRAQCLRVSSIDLHEWESACARAGTSSCAALPEWYQDQCHRLVHERHVHAYRRAMNE